MKTFLSRREALGTAVALLCTRQVAAGADLAQQVTDVVEQMRTKHGLAAILCGAWIGDGEIATIARGHSMTAVPATKDMHLRAGGVTLTCLCMILLRLADKGVVTLEDKLARWYPQLPEANAVTLRMLANCTSGYPDYVLADSFVAAFLKDPFRQWQAKELIDVGMAKPLHYRPGTGWNYCHTNFVILGEVLQQVTGKSTNELFKEHVFTPLNLKETEYPNSAAMRLPVLHAFSTERGIYEDSTFWSPSWTSHSGIMTSNLHDLGVLARAMGAGTLLSEKARREQVTTTVGLGGNQANLYYGLGIILMNGWMVQNPRFGGYNLIFAHLPTKKLSVVLVTTLGPKNSPDTAYSTLLFKDLVKILTPDSPLPEGFR